jgi:hypothetical protein
MTQKVIRYGTPEHQVLQDALLDRLNLSREKMSQRYTDWIEMEERFLAYIPATLADKQRKDMKKAGKHQFSTIEIPYSYAVALTAHTYWTSVFLSRTPVFQFQGRHGEPQNQVQAVEAIMDYQFNVGTMATPLYTWLLDPTKYGFGVVGNYWDEEEIVVSKIEEQPDTYLGIPLPGSSKKVRTTERIPGYMGNKLYNVRPQDWFPDPRVPISRFQEGEFVARYVEVGWNTILRRQQKGRYFNIEQLNRRRQAVFDKEQGSSQITLPEAAEEYPLGPPRDDRKAKRDRPFVGLHEIYVELVPDEWKLGTTKWPEKWVFTLAEKDIIIGAQPLGLYHNKFPFAVQAYEPDSYALFNRSLMEIMGPLQDTLSWLLNSHMHNVRKSINDQFIVDPSRIVMKDITDPNAGRLIRVKPEYYGMPVKDAVEQLAVVDITRGHLKDAEVITDLIERVTGVNDNIMGAVNEGGRKTATEVRASSSFGINRLKTNAEYMSAMGWQPLAQMMLQNTQQFYDVERQFRIAGDVMGPEGAFLDVSPESIHGFFDYVPVDGTLPVDRFAQANLWREFLRDIGSAPELAQGYDVKKIIAHMMQLAGAKNIKQFEIQVTPDQQVAEQAQAGNLVPITGQNSAGEPQAPQVGGVGPTG